MASTAFTYKELQGQLRQFRSLGLSVNCLLTHPYPILLAEVKRIALGVAKKVNNSSKLVCSVSVTERQTKVLDEWQSSGYDIVKLVPSPVCSGHLLVDLSRRNLIPVILATEFVEAAYPYIVESHALSLFISPDGFQCKSNIVNFKCWPCCPLFLFEKE